MSSYDAIEDNLATTVEQDDGNPFSWRDDDPERGSASWTVVVLMLFALATTAGLVWLLNAQRPDAVPRFCGQYVCAQIHTSAQRSH